MEPNKATLASESFSEGWLELDNTRLFTSNHQDMSKPQPQYFPQISSRPTSSRPENGWRNSKSLHENHNHGFHFDVPGSKKNNAMVDAGQIFSHGSMNPVISRSKTGVESDYRTFTSEFSFNLPPKSSSEVFWRWKKTSSRAFQKFLKYFRSIALYKRSRRYAFPARKSSTSSPICSPAYYNSDYENSISEAIHHCKRSLSR